MLQFLKLTVFSCYKMTPSCMLTPGFYINHKIKNKNLDFSI